MSTIIYQYDYKKFICFELSLFKICFSCANEGGQNSLSVIGQCIYFSISTTHYTTLLVVDINADK